MSVHDANTAYMVMVLAICVALSVGAIIYLIGSYIQEVRRDRERLF